jgi:hypothetical protein
VLDFLHVKPMENEFALTRRKALGLVAASAAVPFLPAQASENPSPVLIELFTSQGCSSCPPADKLAAILDTEPGITVVSLNVDYWDYLGWRDTLAKPEYTARQMAYAHSRGDKDVYTPQMVINGALHAVGSSRQSVDAAIAQARYTTASAPLQLRATAKDVVVTMPNANAVADATLWVMGIASAVAVKIERGENSGSTITYHNVVRQLTKLGTWNSAKDEMKIPRSQILSADCSSCIAILQKNRVGPILAMGKLAV